MMRNALCGALLLAGAASAFQLTGYAARPPSTISVPTCRTSPIVAASRKEPAKKDAPSNPFESLVRPQ